MNEKNDFEMMLHMVNTCSEIGGIAECNCHYQAALYRLIKKTGKAIDDLTIGELLTLGHSCTVNYNEMYARCV